VIHPVSSRSPQQARAALTRVLLLAIPASVVAFVPLDFLSGATQTPGLIASRVIFLVSYGLAAWRLPHLSPRVTRITFIALSVATSLALALMCQGTGGVSSPAFTFTWALPLMMGLLFMHEPLCPLAGGLTSLPLGAWLLSSAGKPFVEILYWLMVTVVTTAVATTASALYRRIQRIELEHEKASERRLAGILDALPLAVLVENKKELLFSNKLSRELLASAPTELQLIQSTTGAPYPKDQTPTARALAGHSTTLENAQLRLDGKHLPVEVHGVCVRAADGTVEYAVTVFRDVTERHELQARLARADRLTALGTLSGGVAHEINNPLASVLSNLQLSQDQLREGRTLEATLQADLRAQLADAEIAAGRISKIVSDLGAFSHDEASNSLVADLQRAIEASLQMAKGYLGTGSSVATSFAATGLVRGNEGKLAQVFLNLLMNAAHSFPAGRAGNQIAITTRREPDGRVVAEVRDNGSGISPEHLPRIFEPFFTTRPPGQGTGLGLSTCHGILKAVGGDIVAQSEHGKGSVFRVALLPAKENSGLI
jgi:PAS domain S-box-containing protein